jgi:hypothetical protein
MNKNEEKTALNENDELNKNIENIEKETSELLDKYVILLKELPQEQKIQKQSLKISKKINSIIQQIKETKNLQLLDQKQKELKKIEQQIEKLTQDSAKIVLLKNEKKITVEFEEIISRLNKMKRAIDYLYIPHIPNIQKKQLQKELTDGIKITRHRLNLIKDTIELKTNVYKPKIYFDLKKIKQTLVQINQIKEKIEQEQKIKKIEDKIRVFKEDIKKFFVSELEGKIYIDSNILVLTSKLNGKVQEYGMGEITKKAILEIFEKNEQMSQIINNLQKENISIIGSFSCVHENNGIKIVFELKERKILFDTIIAKPFTIKIII